MLENVMLRLIEEKVVLESVRYHNMTNDTTIVDSKFRSTVFCFIPLEVYPSFISSSGDDLIFSF